MKTLRACSSAVKTFPFASPQPIKTLGSPQPIKTLVSSQPIRTLGTLRTLSLAQNLPSRDFLGNYHRAISGEFPGNAWWRPATQVRGIFYNNDWKHFKKEAFRAIDEVFPSLFPFLSFLPFSHSFDPFCPFFFWGGIQGNFQDALNFVDIAMEMAGKRHRAELSELKGAILLKMNLAERALEVFQEALSSRPDFERAVVGKGTALSMLGRLPEALECLNSLEELTGKPTTVGVLQAKASLMFQLGRLAESLEILEKVIALDPASLPGKVNYGVALSASGRRSEALELFNAVLEQNPKHMISLLMKSEVLTHLERYDEALVTLREVSKLAPEDPGILFEKGRLLSLMGNYEEAEKVIRRGLSLNPRASESVQPLLDQIRVQKQKAGK